MSTTTKTVVAGLALISAVALHLATSHVYLEPLPQSVVVVDLAFDVEGVDDGSLVLGVSGLTRLELRPEVLTARIELVNPKARRSSDVEDLGLQDALPVRVRDGLTLSVDFNELCPEAGDCEVDLPLRFTGRRGRTEQVTAALYLAASAENLAEIDSDSEQPLDLNELVFEWAFVD